MRLQVLHDICRSLKDSHISFSQDDLSHAVTIFQYVASSIAFDFYNRHSIPFDVMCDKNELFGAMYREIILSHTGMDMAETRNDPLSEEIIEEKK